ncbi:hypothetical protein HYV82_01330 [Candidatus Woesearchaeota archaeon]|nr:hypothetical protein [Candidatus Woesearchaeota archaeon]
MVLFQIVGFLVFWVALIAAIILYANFRKFSHIMYVISVSIYVFTVSYVVDVFSVGKNGIIMLLAFSSILMLGLGFYLKRRG